MAPDDELIPFDDQPDNRPTVDQDSVISTGTALSPGFIQYFQSGREMPLPFDRNQKMIGRIFDGPLQCPSILSLQRSGSSTEDPVILVLDEDDGVKFPGLPVVPDLDVDVARECAVLQLPDFLQGANHGVVMQRP